MQQERTPSGQKQPSSSYLKYGGFAFQLLGGIGLTGWLGHRLDLYLNLEFPLFLLLFIFSAFIGMIYLMYQKLKQE